MLTHDCRASYTYWWNTLIADVPCWINDGPQFEDVIESTEMTDEEAEEIRQRQWEDSLDEET